LKAIFLDLNMNSSLGTNEMGELAENPMLRYFNLLDAAGCCTALAGRLRVLFELLLQRF
jgi:hypothetical protein